MNCKISIGLYSLNNLKTNFTKITRLCHIIHLLGISARFAYNQGRVRFCVCVCVFVTFVTTDLARTIKFEVFSSVVDL